MLQNSADDDEAEDTGTTVTADERGLALYVESSWTLSSQLYFFVSEFFSPEEWTIANYKQKLEFWIPTTGILLHALSHTFVVVLLTTLGKC